MEGVGFREVHTFIPLWLPVFFLLCLFRGWLSYTPILPLNKGCLYLPYAQEFHEV